MAVAALTHKVVITTGSNDAIDFKEDGGGELNATLDAGSYEPFGSDVTAGSLAKEVKTQLDATGGTYAVAVSLAGIMTITLSAGATNVQILWKTGSNTANAAKYVCGYGDTDTANAPAVAAPNQVHGVFLFASNGPDLSFDSEDRPSHTTPQSEALSGKITQRPIGSTRYARRMEISFIPRAKFFASDNNDKSIVSFHIYLWGGNSRTIRYFADPSDQATSTEYHVVPTSGDIDQLEDNWPKHSPGQELWSGELMLKQYVA